MNLFSHWWFWVLLYSVKQRPAQTQRIDEHAAWEVLPKSCGQAAPHSRIVGGIEASLGQFPWMARLGYKQRQYSYVFVCGATLISRRYLISAAHCFPESRYYFVRLGEHNFATEVDCEGNICAPPPQDIPLISLHLHEDYTEKEHSNDIALLKLRYNAALNEFVQPICLPQGAIQNPQFKHTGDAIVAGWGLVSYRFDRSSDVLLYVSLPFAEKKECSKLFDPLRSDNSQFCVGIGRGKDSCGGDSGGPLMKMFRMPGDIRRFYLLGIVSYGLEKCGLGPGVYTNVAFFLEWILDRID